MFEAHRLGGTYIYVCELGLVFWISVLYAGGRFIGALNAGQVPHVDPQELVRRIGLTSKGAVSEAEALGYVARSRSRTYEEIKALAQMLGFCADQLSADSGGHKPELKAVRGHKKPPVPLGKGKKSAKDAHSLDRERLLLAALRRGDYENARKVLQGLLEGIGASNPGNFEFLQLRAIELSVLLSREALGAGAGEESAEYRTALEANSRHIRRIQEAKTSAEILHILCGIIDCIGGRIFSFQGVRHASALRKAERFIWEHYTRKLSLQEIAEVSGLSPSYFSSIFKEEMGENLSGYLNRLRVEKAAAMLAETDLSLSEISGACGFEDQSWFSKIFKSYAGVSPGKYRERGGYTPIIAAVYAKPSARADCQNKTGVLQ
jgi:AraC-like DNA-binding protein